MDMLGWVGMHSCLLHWRTLLWVYDTMSEHIMWFALAEWFHCVYVNDGGYKQ